MTVAVSQARALANRLISLDDDDLAGVLTARGVSPTQNWADAFDAADALLEPGSIGHAFVGVSAADADALDAALAAGDPVADADAADRLRARALIDEHGIPYAAVAAARTDLPRVVAPDGVAAPASTDAREAERAFSAAGSLADILADALDRPLARVGSGGLGAHERRRLVDEGMVDDAAAPDELVAIGERAGLLAVDDKHWLVTPAGATWLTAGTVTRWGEVAAALRDALPDALHTPAGGWLPVTQWPCAYPFDPAWPSRADRLRALLRRWAMIADDGEPAAWARSVSEGGEPDGTALQALLPPEVDRVFLQNDLTAIAPGPLAPALEMRLRTMAQRETRAQASSYRFTAESLAEAVTAGESAESITAFLSELSLTGIPQPLAYEIERAANRHGAVQVGTDPQGRTVIGASDTALLRTVAVDQSLRPLGLLAEGERLITRSSAETAFWMLADARYPVVAVDADGNRRALQRHRLAAPAPPVPPAQRYRTLIARLRDAHEHDADAAWLTRELDQAVRERALVVVVVRMPDGSERELTIEATGLGGGRLRGRDRAADVERTLPVSHIVSIRPT